MAFDVQLYGLAAKNEPTCPRINYSIAAEKHKVYIYGGLNVDTNEILDTVEVFDASTYQFKEVKSRGDYKPPGRQGHVAITIDKYTMIVIGGTRDALSFVDPKPMPEEDAMIVYDYEASTWSNKSKNLSSSSEPAPWNLINASVFKLDS